MRDSWHVPQPAPQKADFILLVVFPTENLLSVLSLVERAFSYSGPAVWNSLPDCLQSNTNTFKRQLKTHLLTEAF